MSRHQWLGMVSNTIQSTFQPLVSVGKGMHAAAMVLLGELVQHALDTTGARQWTPSGVKGAGNGVKKRATGLLVARYFMLWFEGFLFRNNGQRLRENFQWRGQRMDCRVDCRFHCLCNTWSKHGGALECLTVHFPTLGVCGRKH